MPRTRKPSLSPRHPDHDKPLPDGCGVERTDPPEPQGFEDESPPPLPPPPPPPPR